MRVRGLQRHRILVLLAISCYFTASFIWSLSIPSRGSKTTTFMQAPESNWKDEIKINRSREALSSSQTPRRHSTTGAAAAHALYDSEYSFVTCHLDYHDQEHQTCHFRNICWDRRRSTFVYFIDPDRIDVAVPGFETVEGTLRKVALRRSLEDYPWSDRYYDHKYLPLEERMMPIPLQNMSLSEHAVHILSSTSIWADNFGHSLVDDVSPLFALMHVFKLVTRDAMILSLHGPGVRQKKAKRFLHELTALLSDAGMHTMNNHDLFSKQMENQGNLASPDLTCMRNLLVGTGNVENLNRHTNHVGAWTGFINALLDGWRRGALLKTPEEVSQFVALQQQQEEQQQQHQQRQQKQHQYEHLVVFLVKVGRRAITNIDVLARETRRAFNNIEVLVINPGNMTLHDQIALAQRATVTFGPCGGMSFFNAFLKEGATAIITDYWGFEEEESTSMEGYFWTHVTRQQTLRYPVLQNEIALPVKQLQGHDRAKAYRHYGVLTLEIDRALHLIGHALYSSERILGMKPNSFTHNDQ